MLFVFKLLDKQKQMCCWSLICLPSHRLDQYYESTGLLSQSQPADVGQWQSIVSYLRTPCAVRTPHHCTTPASVALLSNKALSLQWKYVFNELCLDAIFTLFTVLNMHWFLKYISLKYHSLNETSPLLLCEELRQSADEIEFFCTDRDAISSYQSDGFN